MLGSSGRHSTCWMVSTSGGNCCLRDWSCAGRSKLYTVITGRCMRSLLDMSCAATAAALKIWALEAIKRIKSRRARFISERINRVRTGKQRMHVSQKTALLCPETASLVCDYSLPVQGGFCRLDDEVTGARENAISYVLRKPLYTCDSLIGKSTYCVRAR